MTDNLIAELEAQAADLTAYPYAALATRAAQRIRELSEDKERWCQTADERADKMGDMHLRIVDLEEAMENIVGATGGSPYRSAKTALKIAKSALNPQQVSE